MAEPSREGSNGRRAIRGCGVAVPAALMTVAAVLADIARTSTAADERDGNALAVAEAQDKAEENSSDRESGEGSGYL